MRPGKSEHVMSDRYNVLMVLLTTFPWVTLYEVLTWVFSRATKCKTMIRMTLSMKMTTPSMDVTLQSSHRRYLDHCRLCMARTIPELSDNIMPAVSRLASGYKRVRL